MRPTQEYVKTKRKMVNTVAKNLKRGAEVVKVEKLTKGYCLTIWTTKKTPSLV